MNDQYILRNSPDLEWEKMLPELGKDSPVYSILRVDPQTEATTLFIEFPTAIPADQPRTGDGQGFELFSRKSRAHALAADFILRGLI
jgi:hypothetical protein